MKLVLFLSFVLTSQISLAQSKKWSTLTCEAENRPFTAVADILAGTLFIVDYNANNIDRLDGLKAEQKGRKIRFFNNGTDENLPEIVFEAQINANGVGTGISYDVYDGSRSTGFKCVAK